MALPCHMVHDMEGVGACLFGASGGETWGIDAGDDDEHVTSGKGIKEQLWITVKSFIHIRGSGLPYTTDTG